jgi:diguanylate cyclase (GGDEF)-like protein
MFRFQESPPPPRSDGLGLVTLRRRGFSVLAPLTALAAITALILERRSMDPLDLFALPSVAALMLLIELALRLRLLKLEQALASAYLICTAYLVALFHHQFSSFVPQHQMYSEGVLWFPALYMVAFLTWPLRRAAQIVSALIALNLVIAAAHLWPMWISGTLSDRLLASTSQFFLSGILIALIQYVGASARRQYEEMRRLAFLDTLTDLPNRRAAQNMLERLSTSELPYAVVMFDLDHFKRINERHGHGEGDQVLAQSAQLTGQHLAKTHLLARWGGEEFLMILPAMSSEEARAVAERARLNLADYHFGPVGQVTATFGVAQTSEFDTGTPQERLECVLERADTAMRQAKQGGRNQVRVAPGPEGLPGEQGELRRGAAVLSAQDGSV